LLFKLLHVTEVLSKQKTVVSVDRCSVLPEPCCPVGRGRGTFISTRSVGVLLHSWLGPVRFRAERLWQKSNLYCQAITSADDRQPLQYIL